MTVKELIEALKFYPDDMKIYTSDGLEVVNIEEDDWHGIGNTATKALYIVDEDGE